MIVISSGKSYLDIDGYASCIAYRELLKLRGIEAKFVSNAVVNSSITPSLIGLPFKTDEYEVMQGDKFIILDTSNKYFFEEFIDYNNIVEIIDHHPGNEEYWNNLIGDKSHIEPIGSVATIIFEKYEQYGLLDKMDSGIAKLLMAAILDNTLNFTATITKDRDKLAYKKLEQIVNIKDFDELYFKECQSTIVNNLENTIRNDLKIEDTSTLLPSILGQLLIYDIDSVMNKIDVINDIMNSYGTDWLLNIISLKENNSYILCSNEFVINNLEKLFNVNAKEKFIVIKPNILRKEIMKKAIQERKNKNGS